MPTIESCKAMLRHEQIVVVDNLLDRPPSHVTYLDSALADRARDRVIRDHTPGLLTGRMRGAVESDAEVIVYLDDDVLLGPEWAEAVRTTFADPSVGLVGGPSEPQWEGSVPEWVQGFVRYRGSQVAECAWLSLLDLGPRQQMIDPNYVWGLNFAIRRSVLEECGGFHPDCMPDDLQHFQGDGETGLTRKIAARGRKALYEPRMKVMHRIGPNRLTPTYFYRRAFYQGVCDSYTKLRVQHGVDRPAARPSQRRVFGRFRDTAGGLWDRCAAAMTPVFRGGGFSDIKNGTDRAYQAGVEFHRIAFDSCPAVRSWVLKPDYWDYNLPESRFNAATVRPECLTRHQVPAIW